MESTRKEPPKVLVSKATILLGTIKKPIIIEDINDVTIYLIHLTMK
jgi:hypothetical protein